MKLTAQSRLDPSPLQADLLLRTMEAANAACNAISEHAWFAKTFSKFGLQRAIYRDIRERFSLSAQVVVRCLGKVADAYKLDKARNHACRAKRAFRKHGGIAYDSRILRYYTERRELSIWTMGGRERIAYTVGEHHARLLAYQQGESDLIYRKGRVYLLATDVPEEDEEAVDGVPGVDLGIVEIATTSDGDSQSGDEIEAKRQWYAKRRAVLQSVGTKSAKRRLRGLSGRERRFRADVNHRISKTLVREAKDTKRAIALEDLTGIRARTTVRHGQRARHHSWSFYQLRQFIDYKATRPEPWVHDFAQQTSNARGSPMLLRQIFDPTLAQYAYLIGCQQTAEALLVDPERDIDRYVRLAEREGLRITAVAETHIHADFLSGAREFAERFDTRVYLSDEGDKDWKYEWVKEKKKNGTAYDAVLLKSGDTFNVGRIEIEAVYTPGHTPEHLGFLVTDRGSGTTSPMGFLTGDFVFVGDLGRPDLLEQAAGLHDNQEPSARRLYCSIPTFTALEDHLQVWPAHGAGSTCGKAPGAVPQSTVGYEKRYNATLAAAEQGEHAFVDTILSGQPEPPMYFARMKQDNKRGVPLLGDLPRPRKLSTGELGRMSAEALVIDTRDRSAFMARHLPGALHAPLGKLFGTAIGSLVTDVATPLVLIVEESRVEEAVRNLVRIGYDHIEAYAEPETLVQHFDGGGECAEIPEIGFADVKRLRDEDEVAVVDIRYASEYGAGHVPGAINASYTRLPEYETARIPQDKTLLVHCGSGARAALAAAFLGREGYDVRYVNGAFADYAEAGEVAKEASVTA